MSVVLEEDVALAKRLAAALNGLEVEATGGSDAAYRSALRKQLNAATAVRRTSACVRLFFFFFFFPDFF
jgi:hypothetical protein